MLDVPPKNQYNVYIVLNSKRKIIWSYVVEAANKNEAIRTGLFIFSKKTGTKITKKFLMLFTIDAEQMK